MALFGESAGRRREPRSLVEFRAGKMKFEGKTVTADVRKGLVYMKLDESLLHFCWKDRQKGTLEDDFIIFPGDAEMKRVPQCKTGRVFLLKFRESNRKCFYWMQEPKEEKDEDLLKKVNDLIENPGMASAMQSGGGSETARRGMAQSLMTSQLQSLLQSSDVSPQHLFELLQGSGMLAGGGGAGIAGGLSPMDFLTGGSSGRSGSALSGSQAADDQPSATQSTTSRTTTIPQQETQGQRGQERSRLQLGDLQSALAAMHVPESSAASEENQVSLQDVLTSDTLRPLASQEQFQEAVSSLLPPTGEPAEDQLSNPQFQQAMGVFSAALQSGQLGPLMAQFNLSQDVAHAAATGNVCSFAEALEKELREKNEEEATAVEEDAKNSSKKEESGAKEDEKKAKKDSSDE